MGSIKYTKLPSIDPDSKNIGFDALDGPSFFTYDVERGKYRSAFTFSGPFSPTQNVSESDGDGKLAG